MDRATEHPYPPEPAYEGGWTNHLSAYSYALQNYVRHLDGYTSIQMQDRERHRVSLSLITDAHHKQDAELLLSYGKWMREAESLLSVRDVITMLRMYHIGEVFHLVTAERIDSCHRIGKVMRKGGDNQSWSNYLTCAYLAFNDPTLTPRIVLIAEQGFSSLKDIRERLAVMEGTPLAVADGAL